MKIGCLLPGCGHWNMSFYGRRTAHWSHSQFSPVMLNQNRLFVPISFRMHYTSITVHTFRTLFMSIALETDTSNSKVFDSAKQFKYRSVLAMFVAVSLVFISFQNFLLFHVLVEFFAVFIATLLAVVVWQTYLFSRNDFLMYLGCGYIWIAALDFIHTLVYKGMSIYPIEIANPATQFWISARYTEAVLLLTAPLFLSRNLNRAAAITLFGILSVALYGFIMTGHFPDAFIEGQGLTRFKIFSEYIIITILALALIHLWRNRKIIDRKVMYLMMASIGLTMCAELAFTFYVSVFGISNLIGHIFKLFSFWLIFEAIIITTLIDPVQNLSSDLVKSEGRFRQLAENIDEVFWVGSPDWRQVFYVSPAYENVWGHKEEDLYENAQVWIDAVHPDDQAQVIADMPDDPNNITDVVDFKDYRIRKADGQLLWIKARAYPVRDSAGNVVRITGIAQDITDRKHAEDRIYQLAMTDSLTGLANRTQFQKRINQSIKLANREGESLALMVLDLDLFKQVNDTFGHLVGDALLKAVADIFTKFSRETDVIARLGGDEFAILVVHPENEDNAGISAQRIINEVKKPMKIMGKSVYVGVSIGIAIYPKDAENLDGLFKKADQALYYAKENGRGDFVFYQSAMKQDRFLI